MKSCGANCNCATSSASTTAFASSTISGLTRAGFLRPVFTRSARARAPSACASGRWAISCRSTIRCGSPKRSRSSTRCSAGAWNADWCRASTPITSGRSVSTMICARRRRSNSSIICARPTARRSRSPGTARISIPTSARLSVLPVQTPHPPLWMMSRDPRTLEFCAAERHQSGLFPGLSARRCGAALSRVSRQLGEGRLARASRISPTAP